MTKGYTGNMPPGGDAAPGKTFKTNDAASLGGAQADLSRGFSREGPLSDLPASMRAFDEPVLKARVDHARPDDKRKDD